MINLFKKNSKANPKENIKEILDAQSEFMLRLDKGQFALEEFGTSQNARITALETHSWFSTDKAAKEFVTNFVKEYLKDYIFNIQVLEESDRHYNADVKALTLRVHELECELLLLQARKLKKKNARTSKNR